MLLKVVITNHCNRVPAEVDCGINIIILIIQAVSPPDVLPVESAVDVVLRLALLPLYDGVVPVALPAPLAVNAAGLVRVSVVEILIIVTDLIVKQLVGG